MATFINIEGVIYKVGVYVGDYNTTLRKVLTKDVILRYNLHFYWDKLFFSEKTWLMDHVLVTKDKVRINLGDDPEYGELIDMLSTKLLT